MFDGLIAPKRVKILVVKNSFAEYTLNILKTVAKLGEKVLRLNLLQQHKSSYKSESRKFSFSVEVI